jgi:hypothetical protein
MDTRREALQIQKHFGRYHDTIGEAITEIVEAKPGASVEEGDVIAHVKAALAAFKAPKRVCGVLLCPFPTDLPHATN